MNLKRVRQKMLFIVRILLVTTLAITFLTLGACSNRQKFAKQDVSEHIVQDMLADKPEELHGDYKKLLEEGERNTVLNQMQIGLKARRLGYGDLSDSAFDQAILGIEQIYGPGQQKADVRSLWIEEGTKNFKGEPYERAMAYYYRGLSYFEQSDYGNARAAFRSGQLQDAFAEEDQNRCDFAILMYLDGWSSLADGDKRLAEESYKEFSAYRKDILPPYNHNTLLIVETGKSPRKVADGSGHSELKFRRGKNFREIYTEFCLSDGSCESLEPIEDIFWQSATRGGRQVDKIIGHKAQFRTSAVQTGSVVSEIGTSGLIFAPLFDNVAGAQAIGAGISVLGVTAMAIGQASKPHADTRYWNNLPDTIHIYSVNLTPGEHSFTIRYRDKKKKTLKKMDMHRTVYIKKGKRNLIWLKSK